MDNSIDHRHHALKITFFVLFALAMPPMAFAAPTTDKDPGLALELDDNTVKTPAMNAIAAVEVKEADSANTSNAAETGLRGFGLNPMPGMTEHMKPAEPPGHEISSSIKEALRPLHDDLAETGLFNTIRNLESDLGLSSNRDAREGANHGQSADNANDNEPRARSWGNSGETRAAGTRPRTEAEAHEDKIRASVMLQQLIDEVTPWIVAAVGLYLVGYGIKLLLAHRRAKAARRRSRNNKHRRHRRRSRNPAEQAQAQALAPDAPDAARSSTPVEGNLRQ
jgi:hypothetical protein